MDLNQILRMYSFIALANIMITVTYKYTCSFITEHSSANEH